MDGVDYNFPTASKARKKRKLTKFQGESSHSGGNNKNSMHIPDSSFCLNDNRNSLYSQTPLQDVSNLITTTPSEHHNVQNQRNKQKGFHGHGGINLINRFTDTLRNQTNNVPVRTPNRAGNSNRKLHHIYQDPIAINDVPPTIPYQNYTHCSDEEDANSDDGNSLADSFGSYNSLDADDIMDSHLQEYSDIGDPVWECEFCHTCMWYQECKAKSRHTTVPKFELCCRGGKIVLTFIEQPPQLLQTLLYDNTLPASKNYQANIRTYNAMFSFTSPGMKFDTTHSNGRGPPTLRLHSQTCHRIGTLLPEEGHPPQYAQLYIFDIDHEVDNRIDFFRGNDGVEREIVTNLKIMLDDCNPIAKAFRMARDVLKAKSFVDLKLKLISDRPDEGRVYNRSTVSEVVALIVGDIDSGSQRDIII